MAESPDRKEGGKGAMAEETVIANGNSAVEEQTDRTAAGAAPVQAPKKIRLFVVIHQGRDEAEGLYSSIQYPLFTTLRRTLDDKLRAAGWPAPDDTEIDLWLDSPGGDADVAYKIALLFRDRAATFRVVVPDYAKSAATLLLLSADEIYMSPTAELGPLDAQVNFEEGGVVISALDVADSVDHLFRTGITMALSGGAMIVRTTHLSRKETLANILDFVGKYLNPLIAQLDPRMIHQSASLLEVAREYAIRLMQIRKNAPSYEEAEAIAQHLVAHYPSHGFVICADEAEDDLHLPIRHARLYDRWEDAERLFTLWEASSKDTVGIYDADDMAKLTRQTKGDAADAEDETVH